MGNGRGSHIEHHRLGNEDLGDHVLEDGLERTNPHPPARPLIDALADRVERHLDEEPLQRDPEVVVRVVAALDVLLRWFDPEVRGFEHVPAQGPFLLVGNHSGGIYMPDFWALWRRWVGERGPEAPLYSLGFDFLFSIPGFGTLARHIGTVPANPDNADHLLAAGLPVIVYPGGDEEDYRPWTERHRVDLHGRTGFVRLALRNQVPVIPVVAHGSHDVIMVLTRGEQLARWFGFDRLRIKIFPFVLGPPWGIAPVQLPTWPMPAKVTVQVCEPLDWSRFPPAAADDPDIVRHCYEEVLGRMQATLDGLVAEQPHPVAARVTGFVGSTVDAVAGLARRAIHRG